MIKFIKTIKGIYFCLLLLLLFVSLCYMDVYGIHCLIVDGCSILVFILLCLLQYIIDKEGRKHFNDNVMTIFRAKYKEFVDGDFKTKATIAMEFNASFIFVALFIIPFFAFLLNFYTALIIFCLMNF